MAIRSRTANSTEHAKAQYKTTSVYQYGALHPLDLDNHAIEELWLQNRLWNQLVEIERDNQERYRAIINADHEVAPLEERHEALQQERKDAVKRRNALRSDKRRLKGVPTIDEIQHTIDDLSSTIREVQNDLRAARKNARKRNRRKIDRLERERKEAVKVARKSSGLYWANYNAIVDSYDTARKRAMKTGGMLRFHRFEGEGRFTVQLQGGASAQDLFDGERSEVALTRISADELDRLRGKTRGMAQKANSRRNQRREIALMRMVIGYTYDDSGRRQRRYLTVPVILHRALPDEDRIKQVQIVRRKETDDRMAYYVGFVVDHFADEPPRPDAAAAAGVNLGWKRGPSGGTRVATVAVSGSAKERATPLPWQPGEDEGIWHLELPSEVMRLRESADKYQQGLDRETNSVAAGLLQDIFPSSMSKAVGRLAKAEESSAEASEALHNLLQAWQNQAPEIAPSARAEIEAKHGRGETEAAVDRARTALPWTLFGPLERLRKAKSAHPDLVEKIVQAWGEHFPDHRPDDYRDYRAARGRINKARKRRRNVSQKATRKRQDFYRKAAYALAERVAMIALDEQNLAVVSRQSEGDTDYAAYQRRVAAIHELRRWIDIQAGKRGIEVQKNVARSSTTCNTCSAQVPRQQTLLWTCPSCSTVYDQDANAARNHLDWIVAEAVEA